MTTQARKCWMIALAVLILALVFFAVTGGGSVSFDLGLGTVLAVVLIIVAAWRWGGWRRG